ncbi:uncharacterized protein [Periplaneta americana]|uniref:uncharacterized protein n=1 Tax=Periplaneta americana TaxID=6978 RepID=UPI0037E97C99
MVIILLCLWLLAALDSASAVTSSQLDLLKYVNSEKAGAAVHSNINAVLQQIYVPGLNRLSRVKREVELQENQCCEKAERKPEGKAAAVLLHCLEETKPKDQEDAYNFTGISSKRAFCIFGCAAKKYELADESGFLIQDKSIDYVKTSQDWGPILSDKEDAIKRCITFANSFSKERGFVDFEGKKCNMAPTICMQCLKIMTDINCPDDKVVKSEQCTEYRRKLEDAVDGLNI